MTRWRHPAGMVSVRIPALTIGGKLGLLCLAFSLPVVTLLGFFVSDRQQLRSSTQVELRSARALGPLRLLRNDLTLARSQAVVAAGHGALPTPALLLAEGRVDADLRLLVAAATDGHANDVARLARRWQALLDQPLQPVYTDAGYGALLNQLAAYTKIVGSSSTVDRDPDGVSFRLGQALVRILPAVDTMRTRLVDAADIAALRGRVEPSEEVDLQLLSAQLDALLNETAEVFAQVGEDRRFRGPLQALLSTHQAVLDDVRFPLILVARPYLSSADLMAHGARADAASLQLWQLSSRTFEQLLESRIDRLDTDTDTAIVTTLGAVGVTVFLARLVIRSIRRPLRRAAEVARRMTAGDISAELPADRSDEIGVMLQAMRDVLRDLQERAFTDPLTGLPNRSAFGERAERALAARPPTKGVALLFVDIDHFKQINDVMGHACGDALLVGLAQRLRATVQPLDFVARFGGDEFTILLENVGSVEQAVNAADRISGALRRAFTVDGRELFVTASVGIGYTTDGATKPGDLLREADVALYRSKTDGRNRHTIFAEAMTEGAVELLHLESDLRRAVESGQLRLDFQPIIAMRTGRVVAAEALIRWERPGYGLLPSTAFIPVAEANGLIQPIGIWALRTACAWGAAHNQLAQAPLIVSVNLSPRQIHQPDLADAVARILAETGLPARQLRLEITETAVMQDEESALEVLTSLRDLGVDLLIDDFGTGYSTLRALKQLPVDGVKIDMFFIQGLDRDTTKQVLVRSIIDVAESLSLHVVAEGVEDTRQHRFLTDAGCRYAQGFLYSRPMPAAEFEEWLSIREQDLAGTRG